MLFTFYSFKGGVGRTFILTNVAAILARWGHSVLCVDWDLEAPGMHHYFARWVTRDLGRGVVEWISEFAAGAPMSWRDCTVRLKLPELPGRIDFLPAGRFDETYPQRMQEISWETLYAERDLGRYLEDFRKEVLAEYDFVLVDSRTGITDIGGICTAQLPDILVLCLTANNQSLLGVLDVARRAAAARNRMPYGRGGFLALPVLCRFDASEEYHRAAHWRRRVSDELEVLYQHWAPASVTPLDLVERTTVPYVPIWSFGEELPALSERASDPLLITASLETITAMLVHRLGKIPVLLSGRESYLAAAQTAAARTGADVPVIQEPAVPDLASLTVTLRGPGWSADLAVHAPVDKARPAEAFDVALTDDTTGPRIRITALVGYSEATNRVPSGWYRWHVKTYRCESAGDADALLSHLRQQASDVRQVNAGLGSAGTAVLPPWALAPIFVVRGDRPADVLNVTAPTELGGTRPAAQPASWLHYPAWVPERCVLVLSPLVEPVPWAVSRRFPGTEHLPDFVDLAAGLDALHRTGLVHGDITPRNVGRYVTADGSGFVLVNADAVSWVQPPPTSVRGTMPFMYAGIQLSSGTRPLDAGVLWAQDRFGFALVVLTALAGLEWVETVLLQAVDGRRPADDPRAVSAALAEHWPDGDDRRWQPLIEVLADGFSHAVEAPDWSAAKWVRQLLDAERACVVTPPMPDPGVPRGRVDRYAGGLERIRVNALSVPAARPDLARRGYEAVQRQANAVAARAAVHSALIWAALPVVVVVVVLIGALGLGK